MFVLNILFVIFYAAGTCGLNKTVCDLDDEVCLSKAGPQAYVNAITGKLSGVSSDPLYLDVIETNLPMIKYTLHNAKLTGLKDCILDRVKLFSNNLTHIYHVVCPHLTTEGEYEACGKLNEIPMKGKGTFKATHDNYNLTYFGHYETMLDDNNKTHIQLTKFRLKMESTGKVSYRYNNLFNGDVSKSNEFHQHFAKENWKTVDKMLGEATMNVFQLKVVENSNKSLKLEPVENVFCINE